ncbi:hypothetical protein [Halovenus carboxidivorans]|uniref:hypothetical protein n=1 Tax=Halovenus carboxidivorans TaxID=2692199 RepID=UPI00191655FD|nr:hypothetical protein [Halovenus carboxidivorans]
MLGLRYVACEQCETVFALPESPPRCGRCGSPRLIELDSEDGAAAYFSPSAGG